MVKPKTFARLLLCFLFPLLLCCALAADAAPDTGPAPASAGLNIVQMLIPVLVPILLAIAKFFIPRMPKVALPILAPILGAAIDWLAAGHFGAATILGAIQGSAGVGLREIYDQIKKTANNTP